jgi:hypothetical protein
MAVKLVSGTPWREDDKSRHFPGCGPARPSTRNILDVTRSSAGRRARKEHPMAMRSAMVKMGCSTQPLSCIGEKQ